jgi:hypothetical protein
VVEESVYDSEVPLMKDRKCFLLDEGYAKRLISKYAPITYLDKMIRHSFLWQEVK